MKKSDVVTPPCVAGMRFRAEQGAEQDESDKG